MSCHNTRDKYKQFKSKNCFSGTPPQNATWMCSTKTREKRYGVKKQEDLDSPDGPKAKNLPDSAEDTVQSLLLEEVHMSQGN